MRTRSVSSRVLAGACIFFAALAFLAAADMPRAAYGQFENPHGPYNTAPSGCAACHSAHASQGEKLLRQALTTGMCLLCHDGTGSVYSVVYAFTDPDNVSFHPVKGTGGPYLGGVLECTSCHNPHAGHPRLLQSTDDTNRYSGGPDFCLACHGAVDRGFPSAENPSVSYYVYTLGSHVNPYAAHYDTSKNALLPASETRVTCAACHAPHGAEYGRLLVDREEQLCFRCHNNPTNSMSGRNIKNEFLKEETTNGYVYRTSYHDIFGNNPEAKLECSSCHGPHTVAAVPLSGTSTTSQLSDPRNTKRPFAGQPANTGLGGLASYAGDLSDFCLRCHESWDAVPTAKASITEFVPVPILFPLLNFTTNSRGWWKGGFKLYAHGRAALTCGDCHESHGSDYPALQRYPEDTAGVNGECLRCHDGSRIGAPDIKSYLVRAYRHPTLDLSGRHSDTEDYAGVPPEGRHAECADCHDPHQADRDNGAVVPPGARGPIAGVSGVKVAYDPGSSWDSWPAGASFELRKGIDYQYELCFKCHSRYSYGDSPPLSPSGGFAETDQAREFSPDNPSYHAVVGDSTIPQYVYEGETYYYGKFVNGWTATSRLYCTDCHTFGGSRGPHGSDYPFLLRAPWDPDTGPDGRSGTGGSSAGDTSGHLCFRCHDYQFYTGQDPGGPTERSKFSDVASGSYNMHHTGLGCAVCHGAVPHGWKRRGLLVNVTDEMPYSFGSRLALSSVPSVGAWKCLGYCHRF